MPAQPKPILARIAQKIVTPPDMTEATLAADLANWAGPLAEKPHWIWGGPALSRKPPLVWNGTRPEQVYRVLFAVIYGRPMLTSWDMSRVCNEPLCVSPYHRQPRATRGADGFVEKLPTWESPETVDDLVKLLRAGWTFEKLIDQGKDLAMVVDASMIIDEEEAAAEAEA